VRPCTPAGYKEKIWDHAAGVIVVQEAGGVVSDAGGAPLKWDQGRFLEVGGAPHLHPGVSQLTPRLLSRVETSM